MTEDPLLSGEFREELRQAVNRNGVDAELGIPDYILVHYLLDHLTAIRAMHAATSEFGDI